MASDGSSSDQQGVPEVGKLDVCLAVADIGRSKAFYEDLGFAQIEGRLAEGWAIMEHSTDRIALYEGHIGEMMLNFRGGDVFAIAGALERLGHAMESPAVHEPDGTDGATIRDPDGHLIYFNTP